jgi:hypothetical protein
VTEAAMIIYEMGDTLGAAQVVANLPPVPKQPHKRMVSDGFCDFLI